MNIRFGLPKREVVNKEKYPTTPVLTMEHVEDKGFNRRFVLNKKAIELLGIEPGVNYVSFAYDGDNTAYIANAMEEDSILIGKNKAFSSKKHYEQISKIYKLQSNIDNDFELTDPINLGNVTIYRMKLLNFDDYAVVINNPVVDKEIEHLVEQENINFQELLSGEEMYMNDILDEDIADESGEPDGEIKEVGREKFLMNAY